MTAATAFEETEAPPAPEQRTGPQLVPADEARTEHDSDAADEARAESAVFRDAAIGAVIGALVFAPIYAALVWLAIRSHDTPMAGPLLMAAGVGVLAGIFVGGWSGTLVGATTLEKFEREHRPKATHT